MQPANLARGTLDVGCDEVWEDEGTPSSGCLGWNCIRLDCLFGGVVVLESLGIERSLGAIWN